MIKKIISLVLILCFAFLNSNIACAKYIYEKPENIEITKEEPEELESFLGKDYRVYKYKIQNNEKETYKIIVELNEIEEIYKKSARKFRKGMLHQTVGDMLFVPFIVSGGILFYCILPTGYTAKDASKRIISFILDSCIVQPAKSTVMLPYDTVKNIAGTKKARKELEKYEEHLVNKYTPITLKSGKEFEFYAFTNKNTEEIHFEMKSDRNTYFFNY